MANVAADERLSAPFLDVEAGPSSSRSSEESVDAALVARARCGDLTAEEALYRRHVRYVAGLVGRLVGERVETEDCVQETFAIALGALGRLREGEALRGWLAQIAVNLVRRRFRRRRVMRLLRLDRGDEHVTPDAFVWSGASPEVHTELALVWAAVEELPTEQRIAWTLRNVEGNALGEVAALCDCSLATAKRRIAAADALLRARLGREVLA